MGNLLFGKENKKDNKPKKAATGEKTPKRSFLSRFDLLNRFRHWFLGGVSLTRKTKLSDLKEYEREIKWQNNRWLRRCWRRSRM